MAKNTNQSTTESKNQLIKQGQLHFVRHICICKAVTLRLPGKGDDPIYRNSSMQKTRS